MIEQWTLLHGRLHRVLQQKQFLPAEARVLVAVSGGQDSLCLLRLLLDLQGRWRWNIAVAHCDHLWATDVGIADRVREIAATWNVPLYLKTASSPVAATEAAARQWRYRMLTEVATEAEFPYLVTGHTESDRAETLLYNAVRGAGAAGLGALTWQRQLAPNLVLVRPLLTVSRRETGDFCRQFAIPVWEDACNSDLRYARNRLRREVIPYLEEHFHPQASKNLAQTAEILRSESDYLTELAADILVRLRTEDGKGLKRRELAREHICLQRRVIRSFLALNLPKMPNFVEIDAVIELIDAPNRSRTSTFAGGYFVEVRGETIEIDSDRS